MIPVKLVISGFLSYRQPAELDFDSFQLACVSGSNGAGKSTLFDAMTWALFGVARARDDSLINYHSSQAEVTFDFLYEDQYYRVQRIKPREKTALLEFFLRQEDGTFSVLTEHALRETQKRIESTLKLDYETFINAAFFLQGKADLFTQQTPGDRKRILGNILGLDQWEQYRMNAAEMRRESEMEAGTLDGRLTAIRAELDEEAQRKAELKQLQDEKEIISTRRKEKETLVQHARLAEETYKKQKELHGMLETQHKNLLQKLEQVQNRIGARQEEIKQYEEILKDRKEIEKNAEELKRIKDELSAQQKKSTAFHALESKRNTAEIEIKSAQQQLENDIAQLHKQSLEMEQIVQQNQKHQKELVDLQAEVTELAAKVAQQSVLENQLGDAQAKQQQLSAENKQLKQQMDELKEKIELISGQDGGKCPLCAQPLDDMHRQKILAGYEQDGKTLGDQYRSNQAAIRELEADTQQLQKQLAAIKSDNETLQRKQRALDQYQFQLENNRQRLDQWQQEGLPRLQHIQESLQKQTFAEQARQTLIQAQKEQKQVGYDAQSLQTLEQQIQDLQPFESRYQALQKAQSAIEPLQREVQESQSELAQLNQEAEQVQKNLADAETYLQNMAKDLPDLQAAQQELDTVRSEENRIQMALGGAMQKVEVLSSLKQQQTRLRKEIDEQNHKISALKRLEQAFGKDGVPALLIEQALPDIEEEANNILERLSNGSMAVQFSTQSEYKDKKRADKKETLDILISNDNEMRPYEMYSGGEAFRVNFAIRLALSKVLARRSGARLQTLVIDEGFGSQDSEGRQRLIEVINLIRNDFAKILIITHLEELKDAFSARIEVEKTPDGSVIKVDANI